MPTTRAERRARALIPLAAGRDGRRLLAVADIADTVSSLAIGPPGIAWRGPFGDLEQGTHAERQAEDFARFLSAAPRGPVMVEKTIPFDPGLGNAALEAAVAPADASGDPLERLAARRSTAVLLEPAAKKLTAVNFPPLPVVLLHADHENDGPRAPRGGPLPAPPDDLSQPREVAEWLEDHAETRSDNGAIQEMLEELALTPGICLAAVVPGGAICYAIYPDRATAQGAAAHLEALHPAWWVARTTLS
ncbi:MAG: hypothetical protein AAFP13_12360 [Pseudomonadota bacterium]